MDNIDVYILNDEVRELRAKINVLERLHKEAKERAERAEELLKVSR